MKNTDNTESIISRAVVADYSADYAPAHKQPMDFSNTENPWSCVDDISKEVILKNLARMSHYPKCQYETLIQALSDHHGLPKNNFFVGNGAAACIQNTVATFVRQGKHVVLPELSFPLPIFAATAMGGSGVQVSMCNDFRINFHALLQSISRDTALIFLCNPNNPTGLYERPEMVIDFATKAKVPVLVSEAAVEYSGKSLLESFASCPSNLIVVRSFSKVYGLAGLRIGYGVASCEIIAKIKRFQLPFAISSLSEAVAATALRNKDHVTRSVALMCNEREFLSNQLGQLGFFTIQSASNMILARLPAKVDGAERLVAYLDEKGITVLNGAAFSPQLKRFIRISPRTRELNMVLLSAIKKFLEKNANQQNVRS